MSKHTVLIHHLLATSTKWTEQIQLPFSPDTVRVKAITYSSVDVAAAIIPAVRVNFIPMGQLLGAFFLPTSSSTPGTEFKCIRDMQGLSDFEVVNLTDTLAASAYTGALVIELEFEKTAKKSFEDKPAAIHMYNAVQPPILNQLEQKTLENTEFPSAVN